MRGNYFQNSGDDSERFCLKSASGASLLLELRSWRLIQWGFTSSLEVVHRNNAPTNCRVGFPSWLRLGLLFVTTQGCFSDISAIWDGHKLHITDRGTGFPDVRSDSGDLEE